MIPTLTPYLNISKQALVTSKQLLIRFLKGIISSKRRKNFQIRKTRRIKEKESKINKREELRIH